MTTEDTTDAAPRFSPLSVPETYAEAKSAAWKEYMNEITKPWTDCQAKIKECVRQIALNTRKNTHKQRGLIIVACQEYSAIAGVAFQNYINKLMKAYYMDCMKALGLDPLTVATVANKAAAQRAARKEKCKTEQKFSKPEPQRVTKKGEGIVKGRGK